MKQFALKQLPIALAVSLAAVAPLALAQDAMSQMDADVGAKVASFATLDINQSASISKAEVASDTTLSTYFANYDTDGNGELSREEYRHYAGKGNMRNKGDAGMEGDHRGDRKGTATDSPPEEY